MQVSGRNKLSGKVVKITTGIVTAQVELDVGDGKIITGVITKDSLDELDIKVGEELTALIKATSVMFLKQ